MPNKKPPQSPLNYRHAGVDTAAADKLVGMIGPLAERTTRAGVLAGPGGFAGLFELPVERYHRPVLLTATDGVGTKLKLARRLDRHDTIGIDLVAMCANDVLAQGGEPLLFLDYFACGKLDIGIARTVIAGIADGCRIAGSALAGGETAEMPGFYPEGEYDLAGFAVGLAEKEKLFRPEAVAAGQAVIGIASNGVHSNGYSLVHRVLERSGAQLAQAFGNTTLGETLLEPTRIYVAALLPLIAQGRVAALAHITGGGLTGNLPRVLPPRHRARLALHSWPRPEIFDWLQREGGIEDNEMLSVFNCGVGFAAVVDAGAADAVLAHLAGYELQAWVIGEIEMCNEDRPCVIYC